MRSVFVRLVFLWGLVWLFPGCVESYAPDIISSSETYLVVNGFINSQGVSTIKLSRTYDVAVTAAPPTETNATVYIEEEGGARYPLTEGAPGTYTSASLVLNTARNYRLHLHTRGGKEYASDFVPVKTTPPIDNVSWRTDSQGISIHVNSHDDTRATQYYQWEYDETWVIIPVYNPTVEYVNNQIQYITTPYPTICWRSGQSTAIKISKTTALSQDVVADYPLLTLPSNAERLRKQYSILVRQYALTQEEYAYWELLRKNTENIGTLFDPQPVRLTGNIHCLNSPADLALGFVGAHSQAEKRIFISATELPTHWRMLTGYENCIPPDTARAGQLHLWFGTGQLLPIEPLYGLGGVLRGYTAAGLDCIDCRKRGTAVKPSFWP